MQITDKNFTYINIWYHKSVLIFLHIYLFILYVSEDNIQESALFFHHVCPTDWI